MNSCIFCQIVAKEKPAHIVYENEHVLALLPKEMEVYGHTLIIPKQHVEGLYDTPEALLNQLIGAVQILTQEYKKSISATGVNILHASGKDAQQSVPHFHFHILPRFKDDGIDTWPKLPEKEFDTDEVFQRVKL